MPRDFLPSTQHRGCARCGEKDLSKFYGTSAWCRQCHKDAVYRGRLKKIGLTPEKLEEMRQAQGNACAVCKRPESLYQRKMHMDHDHATGAARGLLCARCNQILGRVDDDPTLLRALAKYIERQR